MNRVLIALCVLTGLFAATLIVFIAATQSPLPLLKILACVLLIDQSVVTILYLLAKRLGSSFRIAVLVGAVGILVGGLLIIVQNALTPKSDPQILVSALGAAAIVQGAGTLWQIARMRDSVDTK
jgi:hypothetical protein